MLHIYFHIDQASAMWCFIGIWIGGLIVPIVQYILDRAGERLIQFLPKRS